MIDKFKIGDIVICSVNPDDNFYRKNVGIIENEFKPILGEEYTVKYYNSDREYLELQINKRTLSHPCDIFKLKEINKLDLAIKKLKEDLLNSEITVKTTNEDRIKLRAICLELDIPHFGIINNNTVDINNTYKDLYTTWSSSGLYYSNYHNEKKVLINFKDLVENFNQFKK